ncbi:MAG: hypothetical protein J0H83_00280 [Candidatus Melainabacteria bacterium]|nr:hypothetical protein [Candidatus Melainabacteria bacterium]
MKKWPRLNWPTKIVCIVGLVCVSYVVSILWRVSLAEQALYGRSDLIPFSLHPLRCDLPPSEDSHLDTTYRFNRDGQTIVVYTQLINSFQHAYGSALAAYELGDVAADYLFRANEYFEAICWKNSGSLKFYLDTRKDLANNAAGRRVGMMARERGLIGAAADQYMIKEVQHGLADGRVIKHCEDAVVNSLPTLVESGCPFLAEIQKARGSDKTVDIK